MHQKRLLWRTTSNEKVLVGNRVRFGAIILNIEGIVSLARNRLDYPKSYILGYAYDNGISLGDVLLSIHIILVSWYYNTPPIYKCHFHQITLTLNQSRWKVQNPSQL